MTDYDRTRPVYALRASDGQELWDYQGVYRPVETLLTVTGANGIAYLLDYQPNPLTDALLIARQASDGQQLWQRTMKQAGGMTARSTPGVATTRPAVATHMVR